MKYQTRNKRAKKSKKGTKRNMKAGMNGRHDNLGPMIYDLQPSNQIEPENFEPIQSIQEPSYPTKPILPIQTETQPLAPPVSLPLVRQKLLRGTIPVVPEKPILPTQPETQPLVPPVSLPLVRQQEHDNIHENPMISLVAKEANRQLSWCVMNQTIVNATILTQPNMV